MHHADEVMRRNYEVCTTETVTPDVKYLMKRYEYDDLLVVDNMRDKHIVGVIHAEDVSDEALRAEVHPFELRARHFMDPPPPNVNRKDSITDCLKLMEESRLRVLPVMDETGRCLGIVKKSDLIGFDN